MLLSIALMRVFEAARTSSRRPASVPSQDDNAAALNELDGTRLSLAKAISDLEASVVNKEAELASLKEESRKLELYDPANEHEKELDGNAYVLYKFCCLMLKLKITCLVDYD